MSVTNKTSKLNFSYGCGNVILESVREKKYLGITISQYLSSSTHVQYITKKAMNRLFFLKRTLHYSTHETKLLACKVLIRPILEYANIVWYPFLQKDIIML